MQTADVVVIGSGIVGLAHALSACKRGQKVVVIEQTSEPIGASIRNFGMIWPVGQPSGTLKDTALLSRRIWLELAQEAELFADPCGSLQMAFHEIESKVLREFHNLHPDSTILLAPEEAAERFPTLSCHDLQLALFSDSEVCVNPRQALKRLPKYLQDQHGIEFHFDEAATSIQGDTVKTTKREISAKHIFVCPGANFKVLFPDFFVRHGIEQCQIQMLRTTPIDPNLRIGTMFAGGLTLSHYTSFLVCASINELKAFHKSHYPEHVARGIHVMASQHESAEVTIGDSHTYGLDVLPFADELTDNLIVEYLGKMLSTNGWKITSRWQGIYSKHPTTPLLTERVSDFTTVVASPGGAGMTLSFGFAERNVSELIH